MEYQVIYFSRKGSTKKVADTIDSELGVNAEDVKTAKLNKDSLSRLHFSKNLKP